MFGKVVRWYSEAHLRVFDRLDKRNDYRMVVMMSCELRRPRWSKKIEDKENEIRYNDMGTFFCIFEKNVTRTMSWIESTWDEVDQRVESWSRPSKGVEVQMYPDSTMPKGRRVGPVKLAPGDRGAELARDGIPNARLGWSSHAGQ